MKRTCLSVCALLISALAGFGQENNDFYDNTPEKRLTGVLRIEVRGEVADPGFVDLGALPRRSLIVREARLENGEVAFIGAYRYEGYSLFDILKEKVVAKKNQEEFSSIVDLLVAVENRKGEKVVLSWGEIYYPAALHRIVIADRVAPILPKEEAEIWPQPDNMKLVCGNDLVSERNVEAPTRITVFSAPVRLGGKKGLKPLYAPGLQVIRPAGKALDFDPSKAQGARRIYSSVFYGRGRGFHGVQQFSGVPLKDALKDDSLQDREMLRRGYLVAAAIDGYRVAISCSELFNRNDQTEFLLVDRGESREGGRFSIFPAADFFSDRALKAVTSIQFLSCCQAIPAPAEGR
ncbi:MAG: hypothetical protein JXO72_01895 [Vicinamibacteria bacterium]|nr:hypothetical protein [Vicinamibacteria bacterium]